MEEFLASEAIMHSNSGGVFHKSVIPTNTHTKQNKVTENEEGDRDGPLLTPKATCLVKASGQDVKIVKCFSLCVEEGVKDSLLLECVVLLTWVCVCVEEIARVFVRGWE